MCLIVHSLSLCHYQRPCHCALTPRTARHLVHPGFHFGRVMCFLEVAGVSTTLIAHATPASVISLRVYCQIPLGLVHLGFHFGGVVMRFVEVAGVSTRLTAFFSTCAS